MNRQALNAMREILGAIDMDTEITLYLAGGLAVSGKMNVLEEDLVHLYESLNISNTNHLHRSFRIDAVIGVSRQTRSPA